MGVVEDIKTARVAGAVRCGFSAHREPSVGQLAREFGLSDESERYAEIDAVAARRLACLVLHRDLASYGRIMPTERAATLADRFLAALDGADPRFFTNGNFHEFPPENVPGQGPSWNPATTATFDTGILVIGPRASGVLWVEDED